MSNISTFVVVVTIITIIILYMYYCQEAQHKFEVAKIKALEYKYELKRREIEAIKAKTLTCPIPGLNDPRSCYFGSNYQCSWNDLIGRCDAL